LILWTTLVAGPNTLASVAACQDDEEERKDFRHNRSNRSYATLKMTRKSIICVLLVVTLLVALGLPEAHAAIGLWGWVRKERRYVEEVSTSIDSVPGGIRVSGTYAFSAGIYNPGPGTISGASIALSSSRSPTSMIADTGGRGGSYSTSYPGAGVYRYEWVLPTILPKSSQDLWFNTPIKCTFTPGFDSSREASPTLLESEANIQVIKIRIKTIQRFGALDVGIELRGSDYVRVELVKGSDKPLLRNKSTTWISWWVDNPQVNREYEFAVRLKLTNLIFPNRVDFVPWMQVYAYESRRVESWSSSEWHGTKQPDPDISIWDVTMKVLGNSGSDIERAEVTVVGFWHRATVQLRTDVTIAGLPFLPTGLSSYLYKDVNGVYSLQLDHTAPSLQYNWISQDARSVTLWLTEEPHTINVPQIIGIEPGVRYYCEKSWISLAQVSAFLRMKSYSHTFDYVKQYLLQVDPGVAGNQTVRWTNAGSSVTVRTDALVQTLLGVRYYFSAWHGSLDADSPEVTFVMDRPVNITAQWTADYTLPILGGVVAAVSAGSLALIVSRRTRQTKSKVDYDVLLQKREALKASGSISESPASQSAASDWRYVEYLAKLEDLKSRGEISEGAYLKLRKEFREKLKQETG